MCSIRERERGSYISYEIYASISTEIKKEQLLLKEYSLTLCLHMFYVSIYLYICISDRCLRAFSYHVLENVFFPKHELAAMLKIFPEMIFQIKEHNKYIHIYYIQHFQTTEIVLSFCIFRIKIEIENRIPIELIEESKELFN